MFDGSFEFIDHVEIKDVCCGGAIGSHVLYSKPYALIRWGAEDSQLSLEQFKKRESAGFDQTQGLIILANFPQPKLTIGALVIPEVFDCRVARSQVDV